MSARLIEPPAGTALPGVTITISSNTTAPIVSSCPADDPCTLTSSTAQQLIKDYEPLATDPAGATTTFTVTMTIPAGTNLGEYILDIEYTERSLLPLLTGTNMQDAIVAKCEDTKPGSTVALKDIRDNKIYRVKKMIDERCWMVENLAFRLDSPSAPTYSPAAQLASGTYPTGTASVDTGAQYSPNVGYNTVAGETTYLYNWCAALGDTSVGCAASKDAADLQTVVNGKVVSGTEIEQPEVIGVCPAPFRLPKGGPAAVNEDSATTANEFVELDIAMGGTGAYRENANTYSLFFGSGETAMDWHGVSGGFYYNGLIYRGEYGVWWSSTAYETDRAYMISAHTLTSMVNPAGYSSYQRKLGVAVRCVL